MSLQTITFPSTFKSVQGNSIPAEIVLSSFPKLKAIYLNSTSLENIPDNCFNFMDTGSTIYVKNNTVKDQLTGKYDSTKTTIVVQ